MDLIAGWPFPTTVACSRSASKAIFAFSAASIFGLVFFVIVRSVYHDRADLAPTKQVVPKSGSISPFVGITSVSRVNQGAAFENLALQFELAVLTAAND